MEVLLDAVQELGIPRILLIAPPGIELTDLSFDASYVSGDRSYAERYRSQGKKMTQLYRELAARKGYHYLKKQSVLDRKMLEMPIYFDPAVSYNGE